MASSIPQARTNLLGILQALTATGQPLEGVEVTRTGQFKESAFRERVTVENAVDIERIHALGALQTNESYAIPVRVEVIQEGDDLQAVETRMWALLAQVEKAAMTPPGNLGGTVNRAAPGGIPDGEHSGVVTDRQVMADATVRIECHATVQLAS